MEQGRSLPLAPRRVRRLSGPDLQVNSRGYPASSLDRGGEKRGEATSAMFALAERLQARGEDPELLARLLEEAKWGLDWVLKVRFPGGYRIGFAGHNLWTNGTEPHSDDGRSSALVVKERVATILK